MSKIKSGKVLHSNIERFTLGKVVKSNSPFNYGEIGHVVGFSKSSGGEIIVVVQFAVRQTSQYSKEIIFDTSTQHPVYLEILGE